MGIKDKSSYGEYYWAMQVEAQRAFDEGIEEAFTPYFRGIIADLPAISDLPSGMQTFIRVLAEPPSAGFGGFALGVGVEMIDETLHTLLNPMMKMMERSLNRKARETWLTAEQANTLFQRGKIERDYWNLITASSGYEDIIAKQFYESQIAYPSIPDFILYARYHGDPDNTKGLVWDWLDVPAKDFDVWEWLQRQRLTTLQVQTLFRRGIITESELHNNLAEIGWGKNDRGFIEELGWTTPNAMLLVQGDLLQGQSRAALIKDISIADINPKYAQNYLDAILTKPASQDIIAYELRRDPKLSNLDRELRRIGIHDNYFGLYKELAYQIPPVADIITMAVREAFTPAIAAKFGQYEDFPEPLEFWAGKKGLSADWAKRYWAVHWSLTSQLQGFEMLHRGIINESELDMLLRALDVMPFWREKLTGIAYRRLTRVDIRRMYKSGILTIDEVYESYLQHGYTEQNARRMTDFTVQWATPKEASITRSDILTAYKTRMINRLEASDLLADMGEEYFHSEFMLTAVDYKKGLELTGNRIKGIRNLYRKKVYDINKTRDELLKLDLPADEVDNLMEQWYYEVAAEEPRLWTTAQTLAFIKDELRTKERGVEELSSIGYDTEHIDVYIRSLE